MTYFISVVLLTFVNKVLKVKASGHACSIIAPCLLIAMFCGWYHIFPCLLIAAASVWASLYLKRHTVKELLFGALIRHRAFRRTEQISRSRRGQHARQVGNQVLHLHIHGRAVQLRDQMAGIGHGNKRRRHNKGILRKLRYRNGLLA